MDCVTGMITSCLGLNQKGLDGCQQGKMLKAHYLPFSCKMLGANGNESLETSQNGTVDHHWTL